LNDSDIILASFFKGIPYFANYLTLVAGIPSSNDMVNTLYEVKSLYTFGTAIFLLSLKIAAHFSALSASF